MNRPPVVSVYLPTRNRPELLQQAVDSVLTQTFPDFELLIVDDGSEDVGTSKLIEAFQARDRRVRGFRHATSRGAPAARNLAINEARGRFLTGIDDDDLLLPNRLESLLRAEPENHALVCSGFFVEKNGIRRAYNTRPKTIHLKDILHHNIVDNQAMMLTERVRMIGGFDSSLVASQDYDLWTRLIENFGPAKRVSETTYIRREGITTPAITWSPKFAEGARQYTLKHQSKMSRSHLRSQKLLHKITAREPLDFSDWVRWPLTPTWSLLVRYAGSRSRLVKNIIFPLKNWI